MIIKSFKDYIFQRSQFYPCLLFDSRNKMAKALNAATQIGGQRMTT